MERAPLKSGREELLDDSPTAEVEVVHCTAAGGGSEAPQGEAFPVADLSDHELQHKIKRLEAQIERGLAARLPDGGAKLRSSLSQALDESDRRKLRRVQKGGEKCQRGTQPKTKESPDLLSDICSNSMSCEVRPQSSFALQFSQKLKDKAVAAFSGELRFLRQDKNSVENGQQMHKEQDTDRVSSQPRMSTRKQPFRCVADKHKEISPDNGGSLIGSSSNLSSHERRNFSRYFRKRRDSEACETPVSKSNKVQDIVLLDEEGVQPVRPVRGDNPDELKESKIYYPSRDDPESVELSYSDIKCLDPESYLSSPIMNFYIQYLQRTLSSVGRSRGNYYIFNTYFYKKLVEAVSCKGDRNTSFLKLRRWWKGVNLFQKAYILLPIHGDMHWSLVIICFPGKEDELGPIILHLDSLGIHSSRPIFDIVDRYIKDEWNHVNHNAPTKDLPFSERIWRNLPRRIDKKIITVPQQKNEYDCGLFVLYFMERFIKDAPERFTRGDLSTFGSKWFKPEEASSLRIRIKELLMEEFDSARLENG